MLEIFLWSLNQFDVFPYGSKHSQPDAKDFFENISYFTKKHKIVNAPCMSHKWL